MSSNRSRSRDGRRQHVRAPLAEAGGGSGRGRAWFGVVDSPVDGDEQVGEALGPGRGHPPAHEVGLEGVRGNLLVPDRSFQYLGHDFGHAGVRFGDVTRAALAPLGIEIREWATLICLDEQRPLSQAEVARRAGVDRTTMVTLVDRLEDSGLIERRPDPTDRRKHLLAITAAGRELRERAAVRVDECERQFLAGLSESRAQELKRALHAVIGPGQFPG
jgi:DNA-binding MarR family transcriptional regulator